MKGRLPAGKATAAAGVVVVIVLLSFLCFHALSNRSAPEKGTLHEPESSSLGVADTSSANLDKHSANASGEAGLQASAIPAAELEVGDVSLDTLIDIEPQEDLVKTEVALRWLRMNVSWEKQDEVYSTVPRYEDVKEATLDEAAAMLDTESIALADTDAVLNLMQSQIDMFWDAGALAAADAYEHAYLARAIAELALEDSPDHFQLLAMLREAIGASMPMLFAERQTNGRKTNRDFFEAQWPILERQKKLIDSGKIPPSPEALDAMIDWVVTAPITSGGGEEAAVPGWKWLVDNAEAGGWQRLKGGFQHGLACAEEGTGFMMNVYIFSPAKEHGSEPGRAEALLTLHARRLPSLKGGRERRAGLVGVWEAQNVTIYRSVSRDVIGPDGKVMTVTEEIEE